MIVQINGISLQIVAETVEAHEVSVELYSRGILVAAIPRSQVDKVIDFGKVVYTRENGLWVPEA